MSKLEFILDAIDKKKDICNIHENYVFLGYWDKFYSMDAKVSTVVSNFTLYMEKAAKLRQIRVASLPLSKSDRITYGRRKVKSIVYPMS